MELTKIIFAFFHYGLAVMVMLDGDTEEIPWFLDPEVPEAFALVGLGGVGLALGSVAPALVRWLAAEDRGGATLEPGGQHWTETGPSTVEALPPVPTDV